MILTIISFLVFALLVGVDQLTKFLVYGTRAKSIIGDVLWFDSTLNTGAAFSILEEKSWILITISSIAILVFVYLIISRKNFTSKTEKILFGVILSGIVSNLIDRLIFGGVRDFISLKFINFPIFNFADMTIVVGVIVLAIFWLVRSIKKDKNISNDGN